MSTGTGVQPVACSHSAPIENALFTLSGRWALIAILAKAMNEDSLKEVQAAISAKRVKLTVEEARDLAKRALRFKQERGRLPTITSADAWEKRMAEGVAFLARMKAEAGRG